MNEVYDDFDPDNDISYGKSTKGREVMIVNAEISNSFSISWHCKNRLNCNATVMNMHWKITEQKIIWKVIIIN
jgi:hypothetical protein